jgi:hypothetical protein
MYTNLDSSSQKSILSRLERDEPLLVADLRTAGEYFQGRCRTEWKNDNWKIGYVFCDLNN